MITVPKARLYAHVSSDGYVQIELGNSIFGMYHDEKSVEIDIVPIDRHKLAALLNYIDKTYDSLEDRDGAVRAILEEYFGKEYWKHDISQ